MALRYNSTASPNSRTMARRGSSAISTCATGEIGPHHHVHRVHRQLHHPIFRYPEGCCIAVPICPNDSLKNPEKCWRCILGMPCATLSRRWGWLHGHTFGSYRLRRRERYLDGPDGRLDISGRSFDLLDVLAAAIPMSPFQRPSCSTPCGRAWLSKRTHCRLMSRPCARFWALRSSLRCMAAATNMPGRSRRRFEDSRDSTKGAASCRRIFARPMASRSSPYCPSPISVAIPASNFSVMGLPKIL